LTLRKPSWPNPPLSFISAIRLTPAFRSCAAIEYANSLLVAVVMK
jgi:hypothetical protein